MSGHGFQFPPSFQLRSSLKKLSAASSSVFRFLFKASQASDVGSIPIARSINHCDRSWLYWLSFPKLTRETPDFGRSWTRIGSTLNELDATFSRSLRFATERVCRVLNLFREFVAEVDGS